MELFFKLIDEDESLWAYYSSREWQSDNFLELIVPDDLAADLRSKLVVVLVQLKVIKETWCQISL